MHFSNSGFGSITRGRRILWKSTHPSFISQFFSSGKEAVGNGMILGNGNDRFRADALWDSGNCGETELGA